MAGYATKTLGVLHRGELVKAEFSYCADCADMTQEESDIQVSRVLLNDVDVYDEVTLEDLATIEEQIYKQI